jgi:hypothetical protein
LISATAQEVRRLIAQAKQWAVSLGKPVALWISDKQDAFVTGVAAEFPGVPHRYCDNHILAELNKAVLRAAAQARKQLAARKPKLPRGRPGSPEAKRKARQRQRLQRKVGSLLGHRHLFVRRQLTPERRQILRRISRGLPELRALRDIVDEIYRLFDRRCRTETALRKLARLRAHRRYRKMQRTVYRVRTQPTISGRIALDMVRDAQGPSRMETMKTLHHARRR